MNKPIFNKDFPVVMGIINLTPDSFYPGSRHKNDTRLLQKVEKMLDDGAGIIDIGAMSSRPGAPLIDTATELERLIPALENIAGHFPQAIVSVDTFRAEVAKQALDKGAHIINDISAAELDPDIVKVVASYRATYIYMHMKGTPETMQDNPQYGNVVDEVLKYLADKKAYLESAGINNLIADPGFGFGKTLDHNYQILNNLKKFKELGIPILAGISRKSMIYKLLGTTPEESLNGTTVLNTIALLNGADILRVHDVKEAREAVILVNKTMKSMP